MKHCIAGVDPGTRSGAICFIDTRTKHIVDICPTLETRTLMKFLIEYQPRRVFVEVISRWHDDQKIPGSSVASVYGSYQRVLGLCEGLNIPVRPIIPQTWQRLVGAPRCRSYAERKKNLHKHCKSLFPNDKIVKQVADAVLIALAGARSGL